jgi:tetratricopeptide (TPR) repeat protein
LRLNLISLAFLLAIPALPQVKFEPVPSGPRTSGAAGTNQLDSSESVFAVMLALNASGYNTDADSPTNSPLRRQIHDYFVTQRLDSLEELRRYIHAMRLKDPYADLNQYVSYALSVNGPPNFDYRYSISALAPDVARLDGLTPLLAAFYREAHLSEFWKRMQPAYNQAIEQLHEPVAQAVLQANGYMRNASSGYLGRNFQIYVDLLGPPNQVIARSYVDDYFVVVTPAQDPPADAIRHSYLHYLSDPLPLKFSKGLEEKRALIDYAQGSPILADEYKSDFVLLTTECFIKAIESRIDRKPALVDQALREGFVLTPAIADQLIEYEKQEATMRLYFPELIEGIDLRREAQRLEHIDFASVRAPRNLRTVTREIAPPPLTGMDKMLADAEKAYTDRDLPRARGLFAEVLKQSEQNPAHAKAYYGLARISVLERDPEMGDRLFRKVLEMAPDPETRAWSLLYLGKLADSQRLHEEAVEHYTAVLAIKEAPDSVRKQAEQGLKEAFVKK